MFKNWALTGKEDYKLWYEEIKQILQYISNIIRKNANTA